jgi:hypothetical protein
MEQALANNMEQALANINIDNNSVSGTLSD